MKRTLVFLVAAPISVFVVAVILFGAIFNWKSPGFFPYVATVVALLTLPTSLIAGLADGYLPRIFPIPLRASLTALVGAAVEPMIVCGLILSLHKGLPPQWILMVFAVGGAVVMGVCSLLSHDYRSARRASSVPANP